MSFLQDDSLPVTLNDGHSQGREDSESSLGDHLEGRPTVAGVAGLAAGEPKSQEPINWGQLLGAQLESVAEGRTMDHCSGLEQSGSRPANQVGSSESSNGSSAAGGCRQQQQTSGVQIVAGRPSAALRRNSAVSQCSSVLSEAARQQLVFELSPDLPPDSSILEANKMLLNYHETDHELLTDTTSYRPASPEPISLDTSGDEQPGSTLDSCDELRPVSRMSLAAPFCFDDDDEDYQFASPARQEDPKPSTCQTLDRINDNCGSAFADLRQQSATQEDDDGQPETRKSNKRAHTPYDPMAQPNKVGLFSRVTREWAS